MYIIVTVTDGYKHVITVMCIHLSLWYIVTAGHQTFVISS